MAAVLAVIYAIFNEGYAARTGALVRDDLAAEALRLARSLFRMAPHDPEVRGLLALLLLLDARRPARIGPDGELVPLPEQDRNRWKRDGIEEGHRLVRECLAIARPGPFQVQAAIQAVHCDTTTDADTDWAQVLALYDTLLAMLPTPAVAVSRAVALGKVEGPQAALAALDSVDADDHYALAVRADLLGEVGQTDAAAALFRRAAERTENAAERRYLLHRAEAVPPTQQGS